VPRRQRRDPDNSSRGPSARRSSPSLALLSLLLSASLSFRRLCFVHSARSLRRRSPPPPPPSPPPPPLRPPRSVLLRHLLLPRSPCSLGSPRSAPSVCTVTRAVKSIRVARTTPTARNPLRSAPTQCLQCVSRKRAAASALRNKRRLTIRASETSPERR